MLRHRVKSGVGKFSRAGEHSLCAHASCRQAIRVPTQQTFKLHSTGPGRVAEKFRKLQRQRQQQVAGIYVAKKQSQAKRVQLAFKCCLAGTLEARDHWLLTALMLNKAHFCRTRDAECKSSQARY